MKVTGPVRNISGQTSEADPFDFDVRISVIGDADGESGGYGRNPTDDNCSTTCPTACVSEAGPAEDC
jgi:FxLD family lantipeptide